MNIYSKLYEFGGNLGNAKKVEEMVVQPIYAQNLKAKSI